MSSTLDFEHVRQAPGRSLAEYMRDRKPVAVRPRGPLAIAEHVIRESKRFTNPRPLSDEYDQLEQFVFSDISEVPAELWIEIQVRLTGFIIKTVTGSGSELIDAVLISGNIVKAIKKRKKQWESNPQSNVLKHAFNLLRGMNLSNLQHELAAGSHAVRLEA